MTPPPARKYTPERPSKLKTQLAAVETLEFQAPRPRSRSSVSSTGSASSSEEDRSLVQAYCLVGKVRARLRSEVDQPIGSLRRLVGHVNVLDELMDAIYDDEAQDETSLSDLSPLERQQTDSSDTLLRTANGGWMEDDQSADDMGECVSSEIDEETGLVVHVRRIPSPPLPQRAPPSQPLSIVSGS